MSLQNDVTIKRIKDKTNGFTIVANDIFKRDDVSARAKGVYIYILTLPDDWQIYKSELYTHFSEGRGAIDTAFKELERLGYIEKQRAKDENGKFKGWNYIVYESPTNRKPDSREIRNREIRQSENQQLLSTDKQSTDKKQKTDNIYEYGVQMYDKSTPELEKELELKKEKDIPHSTNADTQSKKQEDSESMKQAQFLSQFLFDECRRIDERFCIGKDSATVDRWAKDIEKLIRIDKRMFYEVKEVIAWAKSHHFWTANIMSGVKLREQFPRLYTQMRKEKQDEEKKRPKTREEIYAEMVARYGESQ